MGLIDVIIAAVFCLCAYSGYQRGGTKEVISLLALLISVVLSLGMGETLYTSLLPAQYRNVAGHGGYLLLIVVFSLFVVNFVLRLASGFVRGVMQSAGAAAEAPLGALMAVLRCFVWMVLLAGLMEMSQVKFWKKQREDSTFYRFSLVIFSRGRHFIGDLL